MLVRDIMSTPTIAITSDASIAEAAATMASRGFTSLPVTDREGRLLGLLTEADLVGGITAAGEGRSDPDTGVMLTHRPHLVAALMRPSPVVTGPGIDVVDLAETMVARQVRSVPVLADGKLVGIVTLQDLVRVLAS
ncbi:CBS domain-containing protein [Amycolatopsis sp. CA-230715]|uniref:CBS domain-containing protein n=1 Tax=Amycolatopsis sp. CA-230715 TaxID=2745196 RepID=UPI001C02CFE3|nr:CBS domain-containing protein [Amycolatopsis sp. CA-230715]QWF77952.1 Hypoxic response protein 1 [Amycolatopsis sp. CA-230715]